MYIYICMYIYIYVLFFWSDEEFWFRTTWQTCAKYVQNMCSPFRYRMHIQFFQTLHGTSWDVRSTCRTRHYCYGSRFYPYGAFQLVAGIPQKYGCNFSIRENPIESIVRNGWIKVIFHDASTGNIDGTGNPAGSTGIPKKPMAWKQIADFFSGQNNAIFTILQSSPSLNVV